MNIAQVVMVPYDPYAGPIELPSLGSALAVSAATILVGLLLGGLLYAVSRKSNPNGMLGDFSEFFAPLLAFGTIGLVVVCWITYFCYELALLCFNLVYSGPSELSSTNQAVVATLLVLVLTVVTGAIGLGLRKLAKRDDRAETVEEAWNFVVFATAACCLGCAAIGWPIYGVAKLFGA